MIYHAYQAHDDFGLPMRAAAEIASALFDLPSRFAPEGSLLRKLTASCEIVARTRLSHARPDFGIREVRLASGDVVPVTERAADRTPFGTLLHFQKAGAPEQPRVLLVAPMSGHFSTLLRGTVRTMLADHDVYITDWHNARDVPVWHGTFDFDDYVDHVIRFLERLGPGAHVVAVCQPSVPVLAAAAIMAAEGNPMQPATMTLMGGPIDTRVNPTQVNHLAASKPISWFERNLITYVPLRHSGAMRRVYPGFVQLVSFMQMNLDRHVKARRDLYESLVGGDHVRADAIRAFYDEYKAVMDLPAEFYLQTVRMVFQEHLLPDGKLVSRGRRVEPAAIRQTALLTVEGEKDDICAVGQTLAAQNLCSGLKPHRKLHHVQPAVGHYGVFNGRRWEREIYPIVQHFIQSHG